MFSPLTELRVTYTATGGTFQTQPTGVTVTQSGASPTAALDGAFVAGRTSLTYVITNFDTSNLSDIVFNASVVALNSESSSTTQNSVVTFDIIDNRAMSVVSPPRHSALDSDAVAFAATTTNIDLQDSRVAFDSELSLIHI